MYNISTTTCASFTANYGVLVWCAIKRFLKTINFYVEFTKIKVYNNL